MAWKKIEPPDVLYECDREGCGYWSPEATKTCRMCDLMEEAQALRDRAANRLTAEGESEGGTAES